MNKKTCFCLLLKAGQLLEGVPPNFLFRLIFTFFNIFVSFRLISVFFIVLFRRFVLNSGVNSMNKVWNEQKRLKTAEKSSSNSFWMQSAPKSWSKYTTYILIADFTWMSESLSCDPSGSLTFKRRSRKATGPVETVLFLAWLATSSRLSGINQDRFKNCFKSYRIGLLFYNCNAFIACYIRC